MAVSICDYRRCKIVLFIVILKIIYCNCLLQMQTDNRLILYLLRNGGACTDVLKWKMSILLSRRGQQCVCSPIGEATLSVSDLSCGGKLLWCCRGPGD